jgi:hypothetical protein
MPSPSNPKALLPGTLSGNAVIAFEELFWTPISESSDDSYAGWVASCAMEGPAAVIVIRNWQPASASTGGHWG